MQWFKILLVFFFSPVLASACQVLWEKYQIPDDYYTTRFEEGLKTLTNNGDISVFAILIGKHNHCFWRQAREWMRTVRKTSASDNRPIEEHIREDRESREMQRKLYHLRGLYPKRKIVFEDVTRMDKEYKKSLDETERLDRLKKFKVKSRKSGRPMEEFEEEYEAQARKDVIVKKLVANVAEKNALRKQEAESAKREEKILKQLVKKAKKKGRTTEQIRDEENEMRVLAEKQVQQEQKQKAAKEHSKFVKSQLWKYHKELAANLKEDVLAWMRLNEIPERLRYLEVLSAAEDLRLRVLDSKGTPI